MPAAIENNVKTNVLRQWLDGETRDKIAAENHIGAGTVSGVINEFKKGVDALEYESVRELSIQCKKQGINLATLVSSVRINNYLNKLGANQDEIETHIADIANSPDPKKLFDAANQIAQISIPLDMLSDNIKRQQEEKQRLEEEIKEAGAILESTNVDIRTLNEYRKLEEALRKHGFSMKHPYNLISVLQTISQIGYDPKKIVSVCSRIKSLRQKERQLVQSCKALEFRLNGFREILPMCEQIMRVGISFPELLAIHTAVVKKADNANLSREAAAYRVMEDIENYNRLGGLKKQLNDISMQIFMMNQILGRQNNAVNALMRLQSIGVTDEEILNINEFLNAARFQYAKTPMDHKNNV